MSVFAYQDLVTGEVVFSQREAVELYRLGHRIALLGPDNRILTYWEAE